MSQATETTDRVKVAVPVALLARLIASQQLCAADLQALDSDSHEQLRHLMLSVCAQQLKGESHQCLGCASQALCQQLGAESAPALGATWSVGSMRLQ